MPMYVLGSQRVGVSLGISQQCEFDRQRHYPCRFRSVIFSTLQLMVFVLCVCDQLVDPAHVAG